MATRKNLIANGAEITPLTREELILAGKEVTPLNEKERTMTAAVSGGSGEKSDFTTCQVTIKNNTSQAINIPIPCVIDSVGGSGSVCDGEVNANQEATFNCILYKGGCQALLDPEGLSVNCEGLISYDEGEFAITGDGTITISTSTD